MAHPFSTTSTYLVNSLACFVRRTEIFHKIKSFVVDKEVREKKSDPHKANRF